MAEAGAPDGRPRARGRWRRCRPRSTRARRPPLSAGRRWRCPASGRQMASQRAREPRTSSRRSGAPPWPRRASPRRRRRARADRPAPGRSPGRAPREKDRPAAECSTGEQKALDPEPGSGPGRATFACRIRSQILYCCWTRWPRTWTPSGGPRSSTKSRRWACRLSSPGPTRRCSRPEGRALGVPRGRRRADAPD